MTNSATLSPEPRGGAATEGPAPAASLASVPLRGVRRTAAQKSGRLPLNTGVLGGALPARPAGRRQPRGVDELIAYWSQLRGGRRLPSPADLDPAAVCGSWANTLLLRFEPQGDETPAEAPPRPIRLADGVQGTHEQPTVTLTPMVIDWLLGLARRTLREAAVLREAMRFPAPVGGRIEAVLLPLSLRGEADHVLCHLRRT